MSNGNGDTLEDQILSRFLDNIEENEEVSSEIEELVRDVSDEDDFGGRDQLEQKALEVKDVDED